MKVNDWISRLAARMGRSVQRAGQNAGPAILAGGMLFSGPASAAVLYSENFEGLKLQEVVSDSENPDFGDVWTDTLPAGWARDNTDTPPANIDDPTIGPDEFFGFTFVNKDWWVATAGVGGGNEDRVQFTKGIGTVMVADADEYDDQAKDDGRALNQDGNVDVPGLMNVFITTQAIDLSKSDATTAELKFDSSFRPYDLMTGLVDVSFDNGTTWKNLLTLDLDAFDGANSSLDRVDETVTLKLNAPATATSAKIRFGMVDAGNDWWWALDNLSVSAEPGRGGTPGDFDGDGQLTATDIDQLSAAVRAGTNVAKFDLNGDNVVDQADRSQWINVLRKTYSGDSDLNGEFNSSDFVTVFGAGEYEDAVAGNSTWGEGDWDGDGDFTSSDFVDAFGAGGYEQGPRAAIAAVPEPASGLLLAAGSIGSLWVLRRRGR